MSTRETLLTELHNRMASELVKLIVRETTKVGGGPNDILLTTESVVMGVVLAVVKLGGDEKVLDVMIHNVRARLAEARLGDLQPAGKG